MSAIRQDEALAQAYDGITAWSTAWTTPACNGPPDAGAGSSPTCCFHVLGDAQRALVALASPVDGPADVDDVSYWRDFARR